MNPAYHYLLMMLFAGAAISAPQVAASDRPPNVRINEPAQCFSVGFEDRLKRGVIGYSDVLDIPGVNIGIVASGSLAHEASFGYSNRSEQKVTSPDTLYNIASVTKLFTATLALVLAEEGVVELDQPISKYLPSDIRVPAGATGGAITIRHLLSHSSGLPKNPPNRRNLKIDGRIDPGIWDAYGVADLYAALPITQLNGKVGESYEYSNYGYALLGHTLERAAGESYENLLRQRILAPLGMADTSIVLRPEQEQRLAAFYWSEDPDRREQKDRARYGEVAGFIGLTSSVRDLAAFVAAHLQRTEVSGNPIPLSVRTTMTTPRIEVYADPMFRTDMALGWFRETRIDDGTVILQHTGEVDGHTSGLYLDPDAGVGIVILQNLGGDVGAQGIDQIGHWLLALAAAEVRKSPECFPGKK